MSAVAGVLVFVTELKGGTLTSSVDDGHRLLVQPACGWERGWWRSEAVGTLLGPEGADPAPVGAGEAISWGTSRPSHRRSNAGLVAAWGWSTLRTLRTAQWTRASCRKQ